MKNDPTHRPPAPARRFVRMFQPRFAALVEAGTKTQTVRLTPKRMPRAGDTISLRCWTGAPYRSKQRILRESTIISVAEIVIGDKGEWPIKVSPVSLRDAGISYRASPDFFARVDGFADWRAMREWIVATHGLPFVGVVIFWK